MVKKQFIVTMIVDENHNVVRERIECRFCDSVEQYIYKEMDCLANKYANVNSLEQGIEEWGEWIEYKELDIKEDDTCPKCDQYPYSEKENNCPVCFDAIGEYFDDAICDVMNKYIKDGFTSENGDLFFDDDDIVKDFNYHIEGLKKLIKMTHKEDK